MISLRPKAMEIYFCVLCPNLDSILRFSTKSDLEKHLRSGHLISGLEEERHAIDLWIDRHLRYQESLSKGMAQTIQTIPDRNKTLYKGCPVCDRIIRVYRIGADPSASSGHELLIRDINADYSGNNVNHINPHLKYYPYECLICEEECDKSRQRGDTELKEVVKTAVKAMMRRHIIDKHLKTKTFSKNEFEEVVEKSMRTLKVMELERITRKQNTVKPPIKSRKRKSVPGPLRDPKSVEMSKRLMIPMIKPNNQSVIAGNSLPVSNPIAIDSKTLGKPYVLHLGPNTYTILPNNSVAAKAFIIPPQVVNPIKNEVKSETTPEVQSSSEDELSDSEIDLFNDKNQVFGCVFCYKRFVNYGKAFEHYLRHSQVFLECAECNLKFKTINDFRTHNPLHNENRNFKNLSQFKVVRKWVEKFLNLMTKDRQLLIDLTLDTNRVFCPVCLMLSNVFNIESKRVLTKDETIESHIHNHFNYFPYECLDCNYEDIKTEFCLDSNAIKHLFEKHDIKNAKNLNHKELTTYFVNNNTSVHKFDELIQKSIEITNQMNDFWIINSKDPKI